MQVLNYDIRLKCQGRGVSCRHDNASKREIRGKHLQILKMFSSTPSSPGRNIEPKPFQHLAMRDSRRHPVSMIRLKPLPDDVAILDQSHVFRGARLILAYVAEHGAIPLTPSKAFKRVFVNWAPIAPRRGTVTSARPYQVLQNLPVSWMAEENGRA